MRILHVYKDYHPVLGGIENTIRVLSEAYAAQGHDVSVLVCSRGARSEQLRLGGVRVLKAGRLATVASMPVSLRQILVLSRERADVIHIHSPYPLGELGVWLLKQRTPFVITYHSDVVQQKDWLRLYGPFLRRVLQRASCVMPTSPRYLETSPWLTAVQDRCVVVPLGVDPVRFAPPKSPFDGPTTLLFVGRLRYYKGLDTLLRALTHLPGVRLKVVGTGPMAAVWQALVHDLGLPERVSFLGEVPDAELPSIYHQADLFVLPANARSEAFGIVLLEAMASGLPCVSTEVGTGTSWVVQDGLTGHVVQPSDPFAMAEAIQGMLEDRDELRQMAQAARVRVESLFTRERMLSHVMQVYQTVVADSGESRPRSGGLERKTNDKG